MTHNTPPHIPARARLPARPTRAILMALAAVSAASAISWLTSGDALAQASAGTSAASTARTFPADARRGLLVIGIAPAITLDGQAERLAPGARILDTQNRLVLPNQLQDQSLAVNYTREPRGARQVLVVWLLTDEEIRQKIPIRFGLP